ncbi:unnamed protein product [Linum trigynum]|uniref:Uncharacterized protein n=1 Tax=Linum trigynum TaxID=586398 RepID=A0AAV2FNA5_9ROSI
MTPSPLPALLDDRAPRAIVRDSIVSPRRFLSDIAISHPRRPQASARLPSPSLPSPFSPFPALGMSPFALLRGRRRASASPP